MTKEKNQHTHKPFKHLEFEAIALFYYVINDNDDSYHQLALLSASHQLQAPNKKIRK